MTQPGSDPSKPMPDGDAQDDGGGGLAGKVAGVLEGYARILSQIADGGGADSGTGAAPGSAAALIQAGTIASSSSARYAQRLTELFLRHQGQLLEAVPAHLAGRELSDQQRRDEAEALRGFLREVGETALQEARRLEQELAQVSEAVARGVADPVSEQDFQRRAAAKP